MLMPFDPVRDHTEYHDQTSQYVLPPITTDLQQGRLPAYNTIMTPVEQLHFNQSPHIIGHESPYTSTLEDSRSERESSASSQTARRAKPRSRRIIASQPVARPTPRQAKNPFKARKAQDDRQSIAHHLQVFEDFVTIVTGHEPFKPQTKGNGRSSGLRMSKEELMAGMMMLFSRMVEESLVDAALTGSETFDEATRTLKHYFTEGVEAWKQNPKTFQLHPEHLLANANDDDACTPIEDCEDDDLRGACATHCDFESRMKSQDLFSTPDARGCRLSRRQKAFEQNMAARLEARRRVPSYRRGTSRL